MSGLEIRRFEVDGPVLIQPKRFGDERGYFSETWNESVWAAAGLPDITWLQDNEAFSASPGTTRGLHFQTGSSAQAKLLRAVRGEIFDVAVDIRNGSPTYGKAVGVKLTSTGGEQLFVPRGFAHGYQTLTPDTLVAYKCDELYNPSKEGGLLWCDKGISIEWPIQDHVILSPKDEKWPNLENLETAFELTS
ncbi:MAG: dTDP-4-dehydrorhamnose 3,5-epimerase [Pseudomonadota bacterium]